MVSDPGRVGIATFKLLLFRVLYVFILNFRIGLEKSVGVS